MKTYLVTGGRGNIGSFIVEELLKEDDTEKIIVVDNMSNPYGKTFDDKRVIYYPMDISDYVTLRYIYQEEKPKYVFHEASMMIQDSEKLPNRCFEVNIRGSWNVVLLNNEFNIKKMVFASTTSIHGEPIYLPVDEKHPISRENNFLYVISKVTMEYMMSWQQVKFDWIGLRYYNVYSERMNKNALYTQVIRIFIDQIKNNQPVTIYGDGEATMDFTHAYDIARANLMVMNSSYTNEYFNTGTTIETSVNKLVDILYRLMNKEKNVKYIEKDEQKIKRRCGDISKIKEKLGWEPTLTLEEGLSDVISKIKE